MQMRAARYRGTGGTEVIGFDDVPMPVPGPREILVQVRASGLNRADILQRLGRYPAPAGWPDDIPGMEYAGVVEQAGLEVQRWSRGDRVMGLVGGGAHARYVAVHEAEALPIPEHLDDAAAAAIPEAFLTGWDALIRRARLSRGERVLLHAVASGVGTATVQLCRLLGIVAIGTSRSAEKLKRVAALGLAQGIDTRAQSFREALHEPVHAVLDVLGGPALPDNLAVLHPRGRLVLLGFLLGSKTEADLGMVLRKRLEIIGTTMRARSLEERIPLLREFESKVLPHFVPRAPGQEPDLHPVVDRVLPMSELARAHEVMESNETFGKVVLVWE